MNKFDTEERVEDIAAYNVNVLNGTDINQDDAYLDYRKLHYRNTVPDSRVLVFLTGFCIGMVFFYLSKGQSASAVSLLDREHLIQFQNFEVNQSGLFEYVTGLRLKQLAFCIICSLTGIGSLLAYSIIGWYGFEMGLIIFSLVYQYGVKGILLTFSMFLPHGIFYIAGFLIIFSRYWQSDTKSCHNETTEKSPERHNKAELVKKIMLVFAVFCVGIMCEVYVNPEIVRKIAILF